MKKQDFNQNALRYVRLRDTQFDVYVRYARGFGIQVKNLFVLTALYYASDGLTQQEICLQAYSSKQTVSAIIKGYLAQGYIEFKELPTDRRNKLVLLTEEGRQYAETIVTPLTRAESAAMAQLSLKQQVMLVELTTVFGSHLQEMLENKKAVG